MSVRSVLPGYVPSWKSFSYVAGVGLLVGLALLVSHQFVYGVVVSILALASWGISVLMLLQQVASESRGSAINSADAIVRVRRIAREVKTSTAKIEGTVKKSNLETRSQIRKLASARQAEKAVVVRRELRSSRRVDSAAAMVTGGFPTAGKRALERIVNQVDLAPHHRVHAAWHLATWHASRSEPGTSLLYLSFISSSVEARFVLPAGFHKQVLLLENDGLSQVSDIETQANALAAWPKSLRSTPEFYFVTANVLNRRMADSGQPEIGAWLDAVSQPLVAAGFAPLSLKEMPSGLRLQNLMCGSIICDSSSGPLVSVLMPAFNAEQTIRTSVSSLLAQSWGNIEIIIVDDASTDSTLRVARALAATDSRIKVIAKERNGGAYVCRNSALAVAAGEYAMVHDSDDWSHPQRIEFQVRDLIESGARSNFTYGVRVTDSLQVVTKRTNGSMFIMNTSSLLMKTADIREVGGWDEVRIGGDSELMERFCLFYDEPRRGLMKGVPLALILSSETSLTQAGATSIATVGYGARRHYKDVYRAWHAGRLGAEEGGGKHSLVLKNEGRAFPAPGLMLPSKIEDVAVDILLVSDFAFPGGTTGSNIGIIRAASACGRRVGLLHWPIASHAGSDSNSKLMSVVLEGLAEIVVAGQSVRADCLIVNHPAVLMNIPDVLPDVRAKLGVILVNQAPTSRSVAGRTVYDLGKAISNFKEAFALSPKIAPISPVIREIISPELPSGVLTDVDWSPMIDAMDWRSSKARAPRAKGSYPVVGRHARDHIDKWPSDVDQLRAAYCVDCSVSVRILGGAAKAIEVLGYQPKNWEVLPFDAVSVKEFLSSLDVYVYHPHPDIIEAYGRAPMEAMAVGIPVILPPSFAKVFGAAALYANPDDVQSVIDQLWRDEGIYRAQVARGYDYVNASCGFDQILERIRSAGLSA